LQRKRTSHRQAASIACPTRADLIGLSKETPSRTANEMIRGDVVRAAICRRLGDMNRMLMMF